MKIDEFFKFQTEKIVKGGKYENLQFPYCLFVSLITEFIVLTIVLTIKLKYFYAQINSTFTVYTVFVIFSGATCILHY